MTEGTKSVNVRDYYNNGYKEGFQKGKLEVLNKLNQTYPDLKTQEDRKIFVKWKEQLQKEIGGKK